MHDSGIPIWFFIGVVLAVYGAMIFGYGIYEWQTASYPVGVELTSLHTPIWWGGLLALLGFFYVVKFRPRDGLLASLGVFHATKLHSGRAK